MKKLSDRAEYQRGQEAYDSGDLKAAFTIWEPLAERGDAAAQFNLGEMYYEGQGVEKDYGDAFKWFSKAAKQRYVKAQYNLGWMYYNGEGIPKDNIYACMWLSVAEVNGYDGAESLIEDITKEMSSKEIAKAEVLARKCWNSRLQDCPK